MRTLNSKAVSEGGESIFLSAGEVSGDAYGAEILTALGLMRPGLRSFGLGGLAMEAAGLERVVRAEHVAVMGITEILRHVPKIYRSYRRLVRAIERERPAAAVLIDFPRCELPAGQAAAAAGRSGGLVRQSAAVGLEAASAALGSAAGGSDAGDLSV